MSIGKELTVVSPLTGEVVALDGPTDALAHLLSDVREYEAFLNEAKNLVQAEILRRQDASAAWTTHLPGLKITGTSPAPKIEYDELALRESLLQLADEGVLAIEAVDRAVEPVVTYKARAAGLNALRKLGGRVEAAVEGHANEVPPRRYVRIERA